jgi:hypothetical protein
VLDKLVLERSEASALYGVAKFEIGTHTGKGQYYERAKAN